MTKEEEEKRAEKLITYFTPFGSLIVQPIIRDNIIVFSFQEMNDIIAYLEINGFAIYRHDLIDRPFNQVEGFNFIYVQLTDNGRLLKQMGTFKAYDERLQKEYERNKRRDLLEESLLENNKNITDDQKTWGKWLNRGTFLISFIALGISIYATLPKPTDKPQIYLLPTQNMQTITRNNSLPDSGLHNYETKNHPLDTPVATKN